MGMITKSVVRVAVIGALAGGTAVLVAGPQRSMAVFSQAQNTITDAIDGQIDDPIALRSQIRALEAEYPEKIAEVRSDLSDVQQQVSQLERELAVSVKVVDLASADLASLDSGITMAREARANHPGSLVRISFNDSKINLDDAYAKRGQVEQTREIYATRARELGRDLGYLQQLEAQLAELLVNLETVRSEFQAQIFALDAQIDAIARNDRMIEMMEKRQATIDEHSRYKAHSLEQLTGRLASIRAEQQARLESISRTKSNTDYAREASWLLDQEEVFGVDPKPADDLLDLRPNVIEIDPAGQSDDDRPERVVSSRG
jgi:predicted RNase H-like nuclease (RuvC/YqgF family)